MNAPATSSQDIFDVRKIRRLVELMKEHDLSEIDLQQGEVRIQLRRGSATAPTVVGSRRQRRARAAAAGGRSAGPGIGRAGRGSRTPRASR